jgi:hypothetical protein
LLTFQTIFILDGQSPNYIPKLELRRQATGVLLIEYPCSGPE